MTLPAIKGNELYVNPASNPATNAPDTKINKHEDTADYSKGGFHWHLLPLPNPKIHIDFLPAVIKTRPFAVIASFLKFAKYGRALAATVLAVCAGGRSTAKEFHNRKE